MNSSRRRELTVFLFLLAIVLGFLAARAVQLDCCRASCGRVR